MKAITPAIALKRLREAVKAEGDQGRFADKHKVNRSYLNNALRGHRPLTDAIAKTIGLMCVKVFVPDPDYVDPRMRDILQAQHDDEMRMDGSEP